MNEHITHRHCGSCKRFTLTTFWQKFCEINIFIVCCFHENCQVRVTHNTVETEFYCHTVWKFEKFFPTILSQKFRQINFFTKELYTVYNRFHEIFEMGENLRNYHTAQCGKHSVEITGILSHTFLAKIS